MLLSTLNDVKGRQYEVLGVVRTIVYAEDYSNARRAIDGALDDLEEMAKEWGADGVIGITITSASTYDTDDDGCTYPDIIAYGTAIEFLDDDDPSNSSSEE